MIERVVLIKLKPQFATDEQRAQVVATTAATLPDAHGVVEVRVGSPADERTRREWDLCIEVVLPDMETVERYRTDKVHRAYVDVFLRPMMEKIRVLNFERFEPAVAAEPAPTAP